MRVAAPDAVRRILSGAPCEGLAVEGDLDLQGISRPFVLPPRLRVSGRVLLSRSFVAELPDGLEATAAVEAEQCPRLTRIGRGIQAPQLRLSHCRALRTIDHAPAVSQLLALEGCIALERVAGPLRCNEASFKGCRRLAALPEPLAVRHLNVEGCTLLRRLPATLPSDISVTVDRDTALPYTLRFQVKAETARQWILTGRARAGLRVEGVLDLRDRVDLESLPDPLFVNGTLLLSGCRRLSRLPAQLEVTERLDLKDCPPSLGIPPTARVKQLTLPDGQDAAAQRPSRGSSLLNILKAPLYVYEVARFLNATSGQPVKRAAGLTPQDAARRVREGVSGPLIVSERLEVVDLPELVALPSPLWVQGDLILRNLDALRTLPEDLRIDGRLSIERCRSLEALPERLSVTGLSLAHCPSLRALPAEMSCAALEIRECEALEEIPASLQFRGLSVGWCKALRALPEELVVHELALRDLPALTRLPAAVTAVRLTFDRLPAAGALPARLRFDSATFSALPWLQALPEGLEVEHLRVENCASFRALPARLRVSENLAVTFAKPFEEIPPETIAYDIDCSDAPLLRSVPPRWTALRRLSLTRCTGVVALPDGLALVKDLLELRGCVGLQRLPSGLRVLRALDLQDCASLRELPPAMPPPEHTELGGSGLRSLPPGWENAALKWRRVPVTARMLFRPETIPISEVLGQPNVETRRIVIQRLGLERLSAATAPVLIDGDTDAGGPRELLRLALPGDEDVVMLKVRCPSTARLFFLRVPPNMTSCRTAAAWLAGFHDPSDYNPVVET
jgi:hypothetical protein